MNLDDERIELTAGDGLHVLRIARNAIGELLGMAPSSEAVLPWMSRPCGSFVTLRIGGRLRGCIGNLLATRPLREDVRHNAVAAAISDSRFPPLTAVEFSQIRISVSLLSALWRCSDQTPTTLKDASRIIPSDKDIGVVLEGYGRRSTYLPSARASFPSNQVMLQSLAQKAGLAPEAWDENYQLSFYRTVDYAE